MRGPFVDPLAIAMARKLGGGGGGIKPSGEIAIDKNGTYDVTQYASANVNVSGGGGGGGDSSKPVRFLDYDGTVVQSYTAEEFAALEAMPENPDHSGDEIPLTAQGWNWSLADAKAYVAKYGALEVGQMYITTDGKTHIKIRIPADAPENRRNMIIQCHPSVADGVTIDWGDGSTPIVTDSTSAKNYAHVYATAGDYAITLEATKGTFEIIGDLNRPTHINSRFVKVAIGAHVTGIQNYAFYMCYGLKTVIIPNNVTAIISNAFVSCYSLAGIIVPDSVTRIENNTFQECYDLAYAILPGGVTGIGRSAFSKCYALSAIIIPDKVTTIDNFAFTECHALTSIIVPDSVTSIGNSAFYNCYSLASAVVSKNATSIGTSAFNDCYALGAVNIPTGITRIENNTFAYCYALSSINIPENITSIGDQAFYNCRFLASVAIPQNVGSIGSNAFGSCISVGAYHILPTTPPTIQSTTFSGIPSDCIIYVPAASVEDYKAAANWSALASKIQAEPA